MGVQLIGYVVAESPRAYFFQDHYAEEPDWMPKTQCDTIRDTESLEVILILSDWIAKQKEIKEQDYRGR